MYIPYHLYIPAEDRDGYNLSTYFHKGADFISQCLKTTSIMVHCLAGVSRSVSLVIAYFMKYKGMPYKEAYGLVKSKRKIIHPNEGFIKQLRSLEK